MVRPSTRRLGLLLLLLGTIACKKTAAPVAGSATALQAAAVAFLAPVDNVLNVWVGPLDDPGAAEASRARSSARGLMQIHAPTWSMDDYFKAEKNIRQAVQILFMYRNSQPDSYLKLYFGNTGEKGVEYVNKIKENYGRLKELGAGPQTPDRRRHGAEVRPLPAHAPARRAQERHLQG